MKRRSELWTLVIPCCLLVVVLGLIGAPQPVRAAPYTVTTSNDSGSGSLREAIIAANASPDDDVITIGVSTVNLTSALPPLANNGTLTITGSSVTVTRTGVAAFRIFEVSSGAHVTLDGLTITNGSDGSSGGGIYNSGGTLTLTGCTLSGNTASDVGGSGGGIFSTLGVLSLTNTVLSGNSAHNAGGGIYLDGGTATITGSTFSNNVIVDLGNGGGIASGGGAAVTVTATTFSGNTATANGGALVSGGGSSLTLSNSTISGNSAPVAGGILSGGPLTITDSTITGNNSTIGGGGLHILGGMVTLTRVTLSGNTIAAFGSGGGLYNDGGDVTIIDGSIHDNAASFSGTGNGGGGIANDGVGTLHLSGTEMYNNSAARTGGGIYNTVNGTVTVTNSSIHDNVTSGSLGGGGISNEGMLTVTGSTLSLNQAPTGGGLLNASGATADLTGSTMNGNQATSTFGGGIANSGTVTATATTFSGNTAVSDGGGINNFGTVTVINSTFSGNTSGASGGGLANNAATATLTNSTLSGNAGSTAVGVGGGGVYTTSGGSLNLLNTIVANNTGGGNCVSVFSTVNAQNSLIRGGLICVSGTNTNNKTTDPLLGALTGNPAYFPLNAGSPAINAGSNALIPGGILTDQAGSDRIIDTTVDMGSFEFGSASLDVSLALPGRPAPPDPSYVVALHVQVRPPGSTTPLRSLDVVTDTSGHFTLEHLTPASYDIWIKASSSLSRIYPVTLVAGANTLNISLAQTVPSGDANGDNSVTIADFAILAAAFGTTPVDARWDARADFNGSGAVTIADFSLLANSFGTTGAP